jgi:hypothetical protein
VTDVLVDFDFALRGVPQRLGTYSPVTLNMPPPLLNNHGSVFTDGTVASLVGPLSGNGTLYEIGQRETNTWPGTGFSGVFLTVDLPAILAAMGNPPLAGPVTFSTTGINYHTDYLDDFTGMSVSTPPWTPADIGAYMVTATEDWTLQPSFVSGLTNPPDLATTGTITATMTGGPGAGSVTYPILRPPLSGFTPGTYTTLATVPAGVTNLNTAVSTAWTVPPVLTGTLPSGALTAPFLLTLMDTATGSGTWAFPSGGGYSRLFGYRMSPIDLTIPLAAGQAPPLWQRQRIGVVDAPEQWTSGLVTPQSSPWQGGTL